MALAFLPGIPAVALDPDLVTVLFLPSLLMDDAYLTVLSDFRRHIAGILPLAVGAVAFTTAVVGVAAHWAMPGLPWAACFALGAVASPPDAAGFVPFASPRRLPSGEASTPAGRAGLSRLHRASRIHGGVLPSIEFWTCRR